jgi:protease-4
MRKYRSPPPPTYYHAESAAAGAGPARPVKEKRSLPNRILRSIRRILKGVLMTLGTMTLCIMLLGLWGIKEIRDQQKALMGDLPQGNAANGPAVLYWPMQAPVAEASRASLSFSAPALTTRGVAERLAEAATDPNIKALLVSYRGAPIGRTQVEEWRPGLQAMQAAGKQLVFYAPDLGMGPGGMDVYLFASEFDNIVLMPTSALALTGTQAEVPFARDTLDKLGVTPQIVQRSEFKTAFESLTNTEISDSNKIMLTALFNERHSDFVNRVAKNRGLPLATVVTQINRAIVSADEAKAAGLIDTVAYGDQVVQDLQKAVVGDIPDPAAKEAAAKQVGFVEISEYMQPRAAPRQTGLRQSLFGGQKAPPVNPNLPRIALIDVNGTIMLTDGKSAKMGAPLGMGGGGASAVEIADAIALAGHDDMVKGIIVRVDSPGGSPIASEVIRNAIVKAKGKGKKVYVSMGEAAASGGYWVSTDADKIYALPSTMTGSIGVLGGKFAMGGLWEKLGVNWEAIHIGGDNAGMWSVNEPFSESQWAIFARTMDNTYADFKARVAYGRKMPINKVEAIAKGRVWTGTQAVQLGLVDGLKSYRQVQDQMLKDVGLTREGTAFIQLPKPPTPVEAFIDMFGLEAQTIHVNAMLPPALQAQLGKFAMMDAVLMQSGAKGAVISPIALWQQD